MTHFDNTMREVLSTRRYDRLTGRTIDFKQILYDAVGRLVRSILSLLDIELPDWTGYNVDLITRMFIAVGVLIALITAAAIIFLILKRRRRTAVYALDDWFEEVARKQYTLAELLAISQRHLSDGEWREAVRYRFIAALVGMNEKNIINIGTSKTNAQLIREVTAVAPELGEPFQRVVDVFHAVWFGRKEMERQPFEQFSEDIGQLLGCLSLKQ